MRPPLRIDYAAQGHPVWLYRSDDEFTSVEDAVKIAQRRLEMWPAMVGFRIVELEHPLLEPVSEGHVGSIISRDGRKMVPWEVGV